MRFVFRVDASLDIGTGHVMRCLTLAAELRDRGSSCQFICREHPGHLLDLIRQRGFDAHALESRSSAGQPGEGLSASCHSEKEQEERDARYAAWLGADWEADAVQTKASIGKAPVDWLIIDHYAVDVRWERVLRTACDHIMVVDDLADREHDCDLLLDQNLGRVPSDYAGLVPAGCIVLAGPRYALLRPEFAALRRYSLDRRAAPRLKHLLITMGGVDTHNATGKALDALRGSSLPKECRITVVMGAHAPWLVQVRDQAAQMPWKTDVLVNVREMARLMADSDLAIGAAGSTSWEMCCLGVPMLLVVGAENQRKSAVALKERGAAVLLGAPDRISLHLSGEIALASDERQLIQMQEACSTVTDGGGSSYVSTLVMATSAGGCSVRAMLKSDLEQVLAWRNQPELRRYMFTQHEISRDEHVAWFERCAKDPKKRLLIAEEDGRAFGFVQFSGVAPGAVADWGFYLAPDAQKGAGVKLGMTALDYAFHTLALHKVCGQALAFNEKSIRLHRRLNFHQEGLLRQQQQVDGTYYDLICFGLLSNEWHRINQAAKND